MSETDEEINPKIDSSELGTKELVELILNFEKELGLLDKRSANYLAVWAAHRMDLYYRIGLQKKVFGKPHDDKNTISSFGKLIRTIKYCFKSPFASLKRCDLILIPHKRKTDFNGEKTDLNSKFVFDQLITENDRTEIWDLPSNNRHLIGGKGVYYLDLISVFGKIGSFIGHFFISKRIKRVSLEIEEYLEVSMSLANYLAKLSMQFRFKKFLYSALLKIKKPNSIYVVIAYGYTALISAAKELGIKTIELQHGVISPYHLGYHYPDSKPSRYFPDELWVWHSMWKENTIYPIEKEKIVVNKNNHLELFRNTCSLIKEPNSVLIISQGTIGKELSEFIMKHENDFSKYKVYYKLHPGEFRNSESYSKLSLLLKNENFLLIKDELSVYELFSRVSKVVGVYSTALYEAKYFEKEVFIVPITGADNMEDFLKQEHVHNFKKDLVA
ncbi:MAG: hypothetical protein ACI8Q1_000835 [Parvicella sp.]|jgi:hypothetical protein